MHTHPNVDVGLAIFVWLVGGTVLLAAWLNRRGAMSPRTGHRLVVASAVVGTLALVVATTTITVHGQH